HEGLRGTGQQPTLSPTFVPNARITRTAGVSTKRTERRLGRHSKAPRTGAASGVHRNAASTTLGTNDSRRQGLRALPERRQRPLRAPSALQQHEQRLL